MVDLLVRPHAHEKLEELTKNNTQLMNDLKIMDEERGLIWFPSVVNMGEKGLIYPDGVKTDWRWHYAKVIDVPEEERKHSVPHNTVLRLLNLKAHPYFLSRPTR